MNTITTLIRDLFSPLASILGVFLTLYFGIFYVPSYIEETKNEKIERMNEALIDRIQEIVYNEKNLDEEFIATMIKGLELKSNTKYPFTTKELLTQTQESFINNRFIPIIQRYKYFNQIQILKESFIERPVKEIENKSEYDLLSVFSTILSVLITILSTFGIFLKNKRNKEIEIETQIIKTTDKIAESIFKAVEFEKRILDLLNRLEIPIEKPNSQEMGYDCSINIRNTKYYVEIKSTRNPISVSKVEQIIQKLKILEGNFILISNSRLSQPAHNLIQEFNKSNKFKFISIATDDFEEIEEKLKNI
ncbi:hypothetical protein EHQ24_01600 [Leptospira noumeaensis]|uniref:Restriction endonuclease type IV Mrr domain-containing protein n=1 Tax=Leptospira noumeaensis TaxID=2484964 RepID=A0A4R9IHL6_9LEPT|nr:restriction endonuclease [Leptospira noumeaensis]TGK87930.1 hypothetical protein EHQ24_01600 [Leptospira noumeaensis]